tara:strand:- start:654 stop:959 length:306 start_codon:yes stop_codon:yes gene_type:complete
MGMFVAIESNTNSSVWQLMTHASALLRSLVSSGRQSLLQAMCEALQEGEIKRAEELRDRFAMLTALKQDHTQEEGSYDKFLDQDEWYMEARRKAMAPKREK